jgi:hypothetical protein
MGLALSLHSNPCPHLGGTIRAHFATVQPRSPEGNTGPMGVVKMSLLKSFFPFILHHYPQSCQSNSVKNGRLWLFLLAFRQSNKSIWPKKI